MKKLFLFSLFFSLSLYLFSQNSGIGLGVILGEPTGLSAKMWTSANTAIDAGLAWSFIGNGYIHVHTDVLMHRYAIDVDQGQLPVYFGIGAKLDLASNLGLGVRIPFGLAYFFESTPMDIFLELVPVLNLIPATKFTIEGGIGVRYFFKRGNF